MSVIRSLFNPELLPSTLAWWGWFAMFGVLELLAVLRNRLPVKVPWSPLSDYVWALEDLWKPLPYFVAGGFMALLVHLIVRKFH
jgi:hypothetical protein